MEKLNLPPFYVGQKVVYVGKKKRLPANVIWQVMAIKKFPCGCWILDIGKVYAERFFIEDGNRWDSSRIACHLHEWAEIKNPKQIMWFDSKSFAPIEQTFQSITFEEVIKIESPLIGIN